MRAHVVLAATALLAPALGQDEEPPLRREDVARIVDEALAARDEAARDTSLLDRLSPHADLRLREEGTFGVDGAEDRYRTRLRLRVGATLEVDDEVEVGARVVTGSRDDPRSPHATLGDGFDGLELSLDRLYARWRPPALDGVSLAAGKMPLPHRRNPVYGELAWDADVQPEGAEVGWSADDVGPLDSLSAHVGHYVLVERSLGSDAWLTTGQVAARASARGVPTGLALAWTLVHDPTPDGDATLLADDRGNAVSGGEFASDFAVVDLVADVALDLGGRPLVLAAEWIRNLRAVDDEDSGWALGAAWGDADEPGGWRAYAQVQAVERDAVFSPLVQDDLTLATAHRSEVVGVEHRLTRAAAVHLWGLVAEPTGGAGDSDWRVRIDLDLRF